MISRLFDHLALNRQYGVRYPFGDLGARWRVTEPPDVVFLNDVARPSSKIQLVRWRDLPLDKREAMEGSRQVECSFR